MKINSVCWFQRTVLERVVAILFLCSVVIIIALSITVGVKNHNSWRRSEALNNICNNAGCVSSASDLLDSINTQIDPCTDFYTFSCQQWVNNTVIIESVSDRFSAMTTILNQKLKDVLEFEYEGKPIPDHFNKTVLYYKTCLDWEKREVPERGLFPFVNDIKLMGGWPVIDWINWDAANFDWIEMLKKMLDRGYDNGILVAIGLTPDYKNTSMFRIMAHQMLPGLSEKSWYLRDDLVESYKLTMITFASMICKLSNCSTPFDIVNNEIIDAIDLERKLVGMLFPDDFLQDNSKTYNLMTIDALMKNKNTSNVDWLTLVQIYFPNETITRNEVLLVSTPGYMYNFSQVIKNLTKTDQGKRTLANYMMLRQVKEAADNLNIEFKRVNYDLESSITGHLSIPDQWEECITQTEAIFDFPMASMYIRKHFPQEKKDMIIDLLDRIKSELAVIINETTWMDETTQEKALTKLSKIAVMAVYPDNLLNDTFMNEFYKDIEVTVNHYENSKRGNRFLYLKQMTGLRQPKNKQDWTYFPSSIMTSNAFYSGDNNSIFIPLGIAHRWFFQDDVPDYINYGRIGFVLGHELSHAFDESGSKLDGDGNWRNWWENDTLTQFNERTQCFVSMFNNYSYTSPTENKTFNLNGLRTVGENVADDIGVKESYLAYRKISEERKQTNLPGISLTPNQLFWVNYATVWCEKDTDAYYVDLIQNDEHPPSNFRVNSPLANSPSFIEDFNCKLGSKMNPTNEKCHVWGA